MLPIKYTLWAKVNVIFRFTRGYEVVAADILDGNIDLGESQNLQLESKYNRYFYTVDEQGSTHL
ncbi:hypothetical protein CLL_A1626 [Clostridium botulinum B str. Eklund 17B (NRP)]|uniref:Uncharacterized protein n=1 Tax=Clostridium botulinum (strain Eklund 17B / Type B) TaxID=935198 RepID=B2TKU0_CLOBB|nr:hypothetical protein CLL_A1626 [Clostridium botulinum B str. Eklund 17B (NRP)]MCR1275219.1 hypothetical protein [Clostridium botulinum]CDH90538.1 conserved hypothetical protein [Clostridium botulinum B str. Eklund 17B (NRP)]